jgi:DNA ligase 1
MKNFAQLIFTLSTTTKTTEKLLALQNYFELASNEDKVWVIALFTGRKPKRSISSTQLKTWCTQQINMPLWLFNECHHTVGDLSETIALLTNNINYPLPNTAINMSNKSLHEYLSWFLNAGAHTETEKKEFMLSCWQQLETVNERYVFNKLLSGAFRIGVSQQILIQALANITQQSQANIAHKISGKWNPSLITFNELLFSNTIEADASKPYPFYLAYPLEHNLETLGQCQQWQAEWKWDGIRGQIIKRDNTLFVWSRGQELITEKFPEFNQLIQLLANGTVLDGEIIASINKQPLPFAILQTRIGRKNITKKILQEAPVQFFAYDVLEHNGKDIRELPLQQRRAILENIIQQANANCLVSSPTIAFNNWPQLINLKQQSRTHLAEGIMLKSLEGTYQTGRKKGQWWKWKLEPLLIDAVLIYAQKGTGRRSNLYTDYTFAVKDGDKLVPFAKAYSGLTNKEIAQVDAFVKNNALEKFGPVRTVKPELVFEIAFEGISSSSRHKSGVALRFPRINRWRTDKLATDINTLNDLQQLNKFYNSQA